MEIKIPKKRILVMGLPGSGKTTFADKLAEYIKSNCNNTVERFNADVIRTSANDFDFTIEGRKRQNVRMYNLSISSQADVVISDFIAPTESIRNSFSADVIIFMDTIKKGRYEDTNLLFERPKSYNFKITDFNFDADVRLIGDSIISTITTN